MAGLRKRLDALFGMDGFPPVSAAGDAGFNAQVAAAEAFRPVEPATHWKDPIDAVVPLGTDLDDLAAAIEFFTATRPTFTPVDGGWHVTALGYRAGPAGDH